jgi:alpha-tubulin suppressor-like RCC1 family protein
VFTWGNNEFGQLGIGTFQHKTSPQLVASDQIFVSVACGYSHTIATSTDGNLWSWGGAGYGELGTGKADTSVSSPVQSKISKVKQACCGSNATVVLEGITVVS